MNIFEVYRGQWALTSEGVFRPDPWFIVAGSQVLDMGFGKPPSDFFIKSLPEGVIIPGMVNAHTHIELSCLAGKIPHGSSLVEMGRIITDNRSYLSSTGAKSFARSAIQKAFLEGTWFYNDISNSAEFTSFLMSVPEFNGNRFYEMLGFCSPNDDQRIETANALKESDHEVVFTPHSIYGSSPKIHQFTIENKRRSLTSLHLLETDGEREVFTRTGPIWDFLETIGQQTRHPQMENTNIMNYIHSNGLLSYKKVLLAHLTSAQPDEIAFIADNVPHSAWVICERSNRHLGIKRRNLHQLLNSPMTMLIGTDSAATCPDISVLREMETLISLGKIPESRIWQAATFSAYEYLEIPLSRVPYFLFPETRPNFASIAAVGKAVQLRG